MKLTLTVAIALFATVKASEKRVLQAAPTPSPPAPPPVVYSAPTKALKYYGDDIKITYSASLGCGACITGGYIFCFTGKEGDDFSGKTVTKTCCDKASNCP